MPTLEFTITGQQNSFDTGSHAEAARAALEALVAAFPQASRPHGVMEHVTENEVRRMIGEHGLSDQFQFAILP